MEIGQTLLVTTRDEWREWLTQHHHEYKEIWLIYYKKTSGKTGISYEESVEEALCFGWLGTSFMPEHASLFFDPIAAGARRVGRSLADLDLQVAGGVVAFSNDVERLIAPRKPGLAFTLGAMGSRQHNFYNDVYQRAGYADVAIEVQDLWFKKQREAAAARIPDELVLKTNLIGTEDMVRERLHIYWRAGVDTLLVNPDGQSLDERLATLARLIELVKEVSA